MEVGQERGFVCERKRGGTRKVKNQGEDKHPSFQTTTTTTTTTTTPMNSKDSNSSKRTAK